MILPRLLNTLRSRNRQYSLPDLAHDDLVDFDDVITSPANPTVKLARLLGQRRASRYTEHAFMAEGVRLLLQLVENGTRLQCLFVDRDRQDSLPTAEITEIVSHADRSVLVEHRLFSSITDTITPQPVAAICIMPTRALPESSNLLLAIDGIQDPGNLGTIVRTAAAAGIGGIFVLPGTVDPFNPKVVRASAGAIASVPTVPVKSLEQALESGYADRHQIVVADPRAKLSYVNLDWCAPTLLIAGSEAHGPAMASRSAAHIRVSIPMSGKIESLNVATATSILIYEAVRQRSYRDL